MLDVNGWDLIKAIRLAARSNATVLEWLRSPLICRGQPAFAEELLDVCRAVVDHDAIRRHYFHVGRAHWNRSGAAEGGKVSLKKLLYAIRPAAALHWTRTLGSPVPPMNLSALLEEAPPAEDVIDAITALVRATAVTRARWVPTAGCHPVVQLWAKAGPQCGLPIFFFFFFFFF